MPDASLPGAKRARSLTIAGTIDVVLAGLGLLLSCLLGMAVLVLSIVGAWMLRDSPWIDGDPDRRIVFAGWILTMISILLVSTVADSLLLATGIQLLRRSGSARAFALGYAIMMVLLGAMDVWLAARLPVGAWVGVLAAMLSPTWALAQVVAFFVLPSWKALARGSPTVEARPLDRVTPRAG